MMLQVLTNIHNMTTMMFGIFLSAFLLGVRQNRKNAGILFLFFCCEGLIYLTCSTLLGDTMALQLYPLLIHVPVILFLTFYYKYPLAAGFISTLSAYLFCQISNWVGLFVLTLTQAQWCYYTARIITTLITFFMLLRFVCRTTAAIFAKDQRTLCIFGFLPFIYYVFDYVCTKFSSLLYSGNKAIVEFMGFIFCITYLVFLLVYFREYEQAQEISQYSNLMELQLSSIQKEIEQVRQSEQMLSILRHDMRHHMNIIQTWLQNDNTKQAIDYIKRIDKAYDDTIIETYCKNEMVNSVISIYETRFDKKGMRLDCDISIGSQLPCSEIAFCAILSNALENTMHALEQTAPDEKWAKLTLSNKEHHLLFSLENPTARIPVFSDGVPVSGREGHGIGVKSIIYYVEQLHGQCHFSVSGNCFVLRIIL